jgi:hypothetical protein
VLINRIATSFPPPGGKQAIIVIGRSGYSARAGSIGIDPIIAMAQSAAISRSFRNAIAFADVLGMDVPPRDFFC